MYTVLLAAYNDGEWDTYRPIYFHQFRRYIQKPGDDRYVVYDATLKMKENKAGSFIFSILKTHPIANMITTYKCTILVYRDDKFLWAGRPIVKETDILGNITFTCSGVLDFLNDSVLPPQKRPGVKPYTVLIYLVELFEQWNNLMLSEIQDLRTNENGEYTAGSDPVDYDFHTYKMMRNCDRWSRTFQIKNILGAGEYIEYYKDYDYTRDADGKLIPSETMEDQSLSRRTGKWLSPMELIQKDLIEYYGGFLTVEPIHDDFYLSPGYADSNKDEFKNPDWQPTHEHSQYIEAAYYADNQVHQWEILYLRPDLHECEQTVELCKNITDLRTELDLTDFASAVCYTDSNENLLDVPNAKELTPEYTWVGAINHEFYWDGYVENWKVLSKELGKPYVVRCDLLNKYGFRLKKLPYDGDKTPEEFTKEEIVRMNLDAAYRLKKPIEKMEVSAVDLSIVGESNHPFEVGHTVKVKSHVHGIDTVAEIYELSLNLSNPSEDRIIFNGSFNKISGN